MRWLLFSPTIVTVTLTIVSAGFAQTVVSDRQGATGVTGRLSADVRQLASDSYQGREPGTQGEQRTIAYLIRRFQALGLQPAGPDGLWTQKVPLRKTRLEGTPRITLSTKSGDVGLAFPADIAGVTDSALPAIEISRAPMIFVGYGADAPERGWDDFKDVDLHNKVAVFLVNDPDFSATPQDDVFGKFGGATMTLYGRWSHKLNEASRRGAVGALVIHETDAAGYGWNVVQAPEGLSYALSDKGASSGGLAFKGWLSNATARRLFASAGLDFDKVKQGAHSRAFRPIDLGIGFSISANISSEMIESYNVLVKIPGRSAPQETIVIGAHWDGLGIKEDEKGVSITRPGAIDNALGVAGVMEIARRFSHGPQPRRSVIFAAWAAEERGLLGSEYYATLDAWPRERADSAHQP